MTEREARRQVARGASRAGEERAVRRRRTTPLLAGREPSAPPDDAIPSDAAPPTAEPARRSTGPTATSRTTTDRTTTDRTTTDRTTTDRTTTGRPAEKPADKPTR